MMKELALLGYFTSEIGYTQAMRYIETPGRFDPARPTHRARRHGPIPDSNAGRKDMGRPSLIAIGLAALGLVAGTDGVWANEPGAAGDGDWIPLFNGRNLDGWTAKIRHHEPGDNHADTFRVEDGLLTVSYDGYETFDDRFGHLFYTGSNQQPFSHYRLRLEYRFIGSQAPGGQAWARRNSGVMLHAQAPETMPAAQDFPISLEAQFLGGLGDGKPRPTGNLCTPGTHVHINGEFTEQHCIASSSPTLDGDQWVEFEVQVLGSDRITHYVNGEAVITYTGSSYGGGVVSGHRPEAKARRRAANRRLHRPAKREPSHPVPQHPPIESEGLHGPRG